MAWQLRILAAALAEVLNSVPSTWMMGHGHLYITPVPGNLVTSLGIPGFQAHMRSTSIHADKTLVHIK